MEFPSDETTFSNDEAFMVGHSILAQGIYTERAKHVSVYLPGGQSWYDLKTGTSYEGGKTHKLEAREDGVPAFQRAGTIIPRKDRFRRSSTQMVNDPYTLVIALNSSQSAEGELYIDDGKSKTFKFAKGGFIHRRFLFSDGKLISSNAAHNGNQFAITSVVERVIILGLPQVPKSALTEPSNQKVDVECGPLWLLSQKSPAVVTTIRRPNLPIPEDWTVKFL